MARQTDASFAPYKNDTLRALDKKTRENLVIVESPAKAKTIEKFLGDDYTVLSSYGHIRDLEKKGLGVDIDNNFEPHYEISTDKKKLVSELSKQAKQAKTVWLASDEDREGEAIAWHLTQVLGLPVDTTNRIVFHEITKNAIKHAIENPGKLNMNLVDAQQARRVLDRIVGFELSPVLWRKVRPSLSAGRVQSVAVRLIVEREREIIDFKTTAYYRVTAQFFMDGSPKDTLFKAELNKRFDTEKEAVAFLEKCVGAEFKVVSSESKPAERNPAPPFTTSTLQQEAGRKLSMSVAQTMSVAQKLYENGYITYMRTDSVNLSEQAITAAAAEIKEEFGSEYSKSRRYKTNSKGAQEAHEAIRPSYFEKKTIEGAPAEKRLYELIWKRAVASQMASAKMERTTVEISAGGAKEKFIAKGEVVKFDGFMKLYSESVDDDPEQGTDSAILPAMKSGDLLGYKDITATERFTQAPPRYSEASLVRRMEELGIGRPSTYAPTISTIINRGYVSKNNKEGVKRDYTQLTLEKGKISTKQKSETTGKERNKLMPTDIGMVVNDYLEAQFSDILEYDFTAKVEREFDEIAEGKVQWQSMMDHFYKAFHPTVEKALETEAPRNNKERVLGTDPKSGKQVSVRIGRYGPMAQIGTSEEDSGEKPRFASLKKDQLIDTITLEEALKLFDLPRTLGEWDGKEVVIGIGRFGPYVRYDGKFTSLAKTDDPLSITLERAQELVKDKEAKAKKSKEPVKTFAEDAEMLILNGPYGTYISYKGKNYRIPKGREVETLTYDDCKAIVEKSKK